MDTLIYDALCSVVFKSLGGELLCPAESAFGTIEVKTMLDGRELLAAFRGVVGVAGRAREGDRRLSIRGNHMTFADSTSALVRYAG